MGSALVVVVLVVVPLVSIAVSLRTTPRELDVLQQRDAPVALTVESSATWQASTAATLTVHLDESKAARVVAPPWKGTVTAVLAEAGHELHIGDPLIEIDGVRRVLAPSPAPFWRVPVWGDHGPDVDGVTALLVALELMAPTAPGMPFAAEHVQAVEQLAARLGAAPTSVLDLGWLIWSPLRTVAVSKWAIAVGDPAPAPGSALFAVPRAITAVEVAAAGAAPMGDAELRRSTLGFGADGDVSGAQVLDDAGQIPAVRRAAGVVGSAGGASPASPGAPSADGDAASDAANTRTLPVTVRGERVEHVAALPLGAVVTDVDGTHCLVTLDRMPVAVEVIGSDSARVYVRGADQQRVAANPASALGVTRCR